jgi:hypothetical protein
MHDAGPLPTGYMSSPSPHPIHSGMNTPSSADASNEYVHLPNSGDTAPSSNPSQQQGNMHDNVPAHTGYAPAPTPSSTNSAGSGNDNHNMYDNGPAHTGYTPGPSSANSVGSGHSNQYGQINCITTPSLCIRTWFITITSQKLNAMLPATVTQGFMSGKLKKALVGDTTSIEITDAVGDGSFNTFSDFTIVTEDLFSYIQPITVLASDIVTVHHGMTPSSTISDDGSGAVTATTTTTTTASPASDTAPGTGTVNNIKDFCGKGTQWDDENQYCVATYDGILNACRTARKEWAFTCDMMVTCDAGANTATGKDESYLSICNTCADQKIVQQFVTSDCYECGRRCMACLNVPDHLEADAKDADGNPCSTCSSCDKYKPCAPDDSGTTAT